MDAHFNEKLKQNTSIFENSLNRIIDKYSKLQYQDAWIDFDISNVTTRALTQYMKQSEKRLKELESQSLTDLRDKSLRAQDITTHSQLDFTDQDGGADETCDSSVSSNQSSFVDYGMARSESTHLSTSLLDERERHLSGIEFQPEDQDEDLEVTLRSHSSLVDLYPSMISRIGRAWHRQNISDAATSVLKRYRRWRQQPNRSNFNNTFIVPLRNSNPIKNSPVKSTAMGADTTHWSPLRLATHSQDWHAQQESPGRMRGLLRTERPKPILVMDFSGPPDSSNPKEILLNETFDVSPSKPFCLTDKASLGMSFRAKRHPLAAQSLETDRFSMCESQTSAVEERPDIYGSPIRQSPQKARMMADFCRSPQSFSRSPRAHFVESFSREPMRPRSLSASRSSPQKPVGPLRKLYPQNSNHSFQPLLPSPQSATAVDGRHWLRRHSFDSSLASMQASDLPKKVDEKFVKLYHNLFCHTKSSLFVRPPCRFCSRRAEANRGHSSSALAALALSPHRSLLRKRHRELNWESHPQSKRFKDEYCASPWGSKRHGTEMLRRRLSTSEYEHDSLSYSPSKHRMVQRFSTQQRSTDAHQDAWVTQGRYVPAADFSCLGDSFESKMANGYSPRK